MHNYELILHMVGGRTLKTELLDRPEGLEKFSEIISIILNEKKWLNIDMGEHTLMVNPANVLYINIREVEAKDGRT